jgi:Ca2+-binding EF-hand superfamily protein
LEGLTVKVTPAGLVSLVDGSVQLEFGVRADERNADTLQRAFVQSFKMFDSDGNGYLDRTESARAPYFDAQFARFDRDADGKMFEAELIASAAGEILTALSRTSVSVENRGRDLFEILDTSRDRRISRREFLDSLDRFSLWDANNDGQLAEQEVPQLYQLEFERGAPPLPSLVGFNRRNNRGANEPAMAGPVWFQRMDRNGDGDVSRTEFIGTPAQFEALDANQDALIDAPEAAVAR